MKTTMKKLAAYLLALLLVLQIMPVMAEGTQYVSNEVDTDAELLAKLEIINESGPYLMKGSTLQLSLPDGYDGKVIWSSADDTIASVDANGKVTGVSVGKVAITAKLTDKEPVNTYITVIEPVSYTVTYTVDYPEDAVIGGNLASDYSSAESTAKVNNVGESVKVRLSEDDAAVDNYALAGWKMNGSGEVLAPGSEVLVSADTEFKAVFTAKEDANYVINCTITSFISNESGYYAGLIDERPDGNRPTGYKKVGWKGLKSDATVYKQDGIDYVRYIMPEGNQDVASANNAETGIRTVVGFKFVGVCRKVDCNYSGADAKAKSKPDVSGYVGNIYKPGDVVVFPYVGNNMTSCDYYHFEPIFETSTTVQADVEVYNNGTRISAGTGTISESGVNALLAQNSFDANGNNSVTASNNFVQSAPSVKTVLKKAGLAGENASDYDINWTKITQTKSNKYLIEGELVRRETPKTAMNIVVNGDKVRATYDGQPHEITYKLSSDNEAFDETKVKMNRELPSRTLGGATIGDLTSADFYYNDKDVDASFIVNNGSIRITPLPATVKADDMIVSPDLFSDVQLTATVDGVLPGDTLEYKLDYFETDTDGTYIIHPSGDKNQGGYTITYADGTLTVKRTLSEVTELYNIAEINGKFYRLAKTEITTEKQLSEYFKKKTLDEDEYSVAPYDFSNLKITVDKKEYVYNCPENADAIAAGARYYTAEFFNVEAIANKIGGMNGNTPRWLVPESQRYGDPNETDSFHRNYIIKLNENPIEQDLYNMLKVNGSNDYYRLRKGVIKARPAVEFNNGTNLNKNQYEIIPNKEYDFTNVVLQIGDETYRYSDHVITDAEYESYFTVAFERLTRQDRINGSRVWFTKAEGWLDGSRADYTAGNEVIAFHRDYVATLYKGTIKPEETSAKRVTIANSWGDKVVFPGMEVTLTATLEGFDEENTKLQWEYSTDLVNWVPQPGANGMTYTYTVDDVTVNYYWRVVADDGK